MPALEIIGYGLFGACCLCVALMLLRTIVAYFRTLYGRHQDGKSDDEE